MGTAQPVIKTLTLFSFKQLLLFFFSVGILRVDARGAGILDSESYLFAIAAIRRTWKP